jgi:hypothetical protein
MTKRDKSRVPPGLEPLSVEELETGLRIMIDDATDLGAFWDEHIAGFRQSVLLAIRETTDVLLSTTIPLRWRVELEAQLEGLIQYVELADRYIARRSVNPAPLDARPRWVRPRIH